MPKCSDIKGDNEIYGHLAILKLIQILGYDDGVGNAAKRVFGMIAGYADTEGVAYPSIKKMAKHLGVSRTAVSKQIEILIKHEYMSKKARYKSDTGARTTSLYKFNIELAQKYFKTPEIFSKENVTLIVTYLATLLHYTGMPPYELAAVVTHTSDTKRTGKKTYIKNKDSLKKAAVRAGAWEQENERREKLGISKDQDKELQSLYEKVKQIIGPHRIVSFDIQAKQSLKAETPAEKVNELISVYRAEIDKQEQTQT